MNNLPVAHHAITTYNIKQNWLFNKLIWYTVGQTEVLGLVILHYHEAMILSTMTTDAQENFQYQNTVIMMLPSIS